MVGVLPKSKAIPKKIACIRHYVDKMSEDNNSNARFSCLLLKSLDNLMVQILGDIYLTKVYARGERDHKDEIENVLYLTQELVKSINPKLHKEDLAEGIIHASRIVNHALETGRIIGKT